MISCPAYTRRQSKERYAGKYYIERRLYTRSDYIRRNETEEGDVDTLLLCRD